MASAADPVRAFLSTWVRKGAFPGASYHVGGVSGRQLTGRVGERVREPVRRPVRAATLFDLASLTKPLATGLVALRLAARKKLDLDAPLVEWVPEVGKRQLGRASLLDLAVHRSGLPAWRPLYLTASSLEEAVEAICRTRLVCVPGQRVRYSDLGYILLGAILERVGGRSLSGLFRQEVARPLRLRGIGFGPVDPHRAAASERGNAFERGMVGASGRAYRGFRSRMIWGEVHDHNCWTLGGACGHAGLFASAAAVHRLGLSILEPSAWLPRREHRLLVSNLTRGQGGDRSVGFELGTNPGATAGPALSRRAVGHVGFTGTSLWLDPRRQQVFVLLTNRMHPGRSDADLNAVRRGFHRIAVQTLGR